MKPPPLPFPTPLHIGTDICRIPRIARILRGRQRARFVRRVLAPEELACARPAVRGVLWEVQQQQQPRQQRVDGDAAGLGGRTGRGSGFVGGDFGRLGNAVRDRSAVGLGGEGEADVKEVRDRGGGGSGVGWRGKSQPQASRGREIDGDRDVTGTSTHDATAEGETAGEDGIAFSRAAAYLAGRFAAKEAAFKAHPHLHLGFHDVLILAAADAEKLVGNRVLRSESGAPPVALIRTGDGGSQMARVSISHDGEYATAVCMGFDAGDEGHRGPGEKGWLRWLARRWS